MITKQGYKNILLTGEPRCGKTTLLHELIDIIDQKEGIITKQILDEQGIRIGFEMINNRNDKYLLSSTQKESDIVYNNKYYIQTEGLQQLINNFSFKIGDLLYIDEIGPMQLYTPGFPEFILQILGSKNPLLGCIKRDDTEYDFIKQVKARKDTLIIDLSSMNDKFDKSFLQDLVKKIKKSQKYIDEAKRFLQTEENKRTMESQSSKRLISSEGGILVCSCDFYENFGICSHTLALRQIQE